jgi:hypothetical protein
MSIYLKNFMEYELPNDITRNFKPVLRRWSAT